MSDARDKILARRAKFVAAALAGISVAYGEGCKPEPCLKIATQPPDTAPAPCLEPVWVPPPDASAEEASAPASDAGDEDAGRTDAAAADASDAGSKRAALRDAGADAGTKIALPPATRQHKPPFAPPQPCLLMPILQERKK